MNMIAAVDKNWAIGYHNKLLVSIPADMRFFRSETAGKVVIMGKNTLESFPGGQPLKNRRNIVITRRKDYNGNGVITVCSIEGALGAVKKYKTEDIYIIGGADVFRQMLPYCDTAHITKIDFTYQADAYFPNLDEEKDWIMTGESEEQTYYDLAYTFCRYERKIKK